MGQQDNSEGGLQRDPALRQWIIAAVLIALLAGCLVLFLAATGPGIETGGQLIHYRLVSSVTQSPFCPPEDPRLSSLLLERKRWIVCLIGESKTGGRTRPSMYRLINLELWK